MNNEQIIRYSRQILLTNFGETAQEKLLAAKVLVIGAGGLGCPILQYLAASGVGVIGIADADKVSLSNLQRQVLFTDDDIGKHKTTIAAKRLRQMNPGIVINEHIIFINTENAFSLINDYDIIIDGTDNFATRYLINDACVLLNKPLVFGAVFQYEGQIAVFNVEDESKIRINYRHLFPVPPSTEEAPDCATAGVFGVLPGIIGIMQATETIKFITGIGTSLINKLLFYNALSNETFTIDISGAHQTKINMPLNEAAFKKTNYEAFCNPVLNDVQQIDAATFNVFLNDKSIAIIDVRELNEKPFATFRHQQIPLSVFKNNVDKIDAEKIILFCQSGVRSLTAADLLMEHLKSKKTVYNLRGGILSL